MFKCSIDKREMNSLTWVVEEEEEKNHVNNHARNTVSSIKRQCARKRDFASMKPTHETSNVREENFIAPYALALSINLWKKLNIESELGSTEDFHSSDEKRKKKYFQHNFVSCKRDAVVLKANFNLLAIIESVADKLTVNIGFKRSLGWHWQS